jgi:hypothetical protein
LTMISTIVTVNDFGPILLGGRVYDDYRIDIEEAIKTDPRSFFLDSLISRKSGWVIHRS